MSMGHTYKFFGFYIPYTILTLPTNMILFILLNLVLLVLDQHPVYQIYFGSEFFFMCRLHLLLIEDPPKASSYPFNNVSSFKIFLLYFIHCHLVPLYPPLPTITTLLSMSKSPFSFLLNPSTP